MNSSTKSAKRIKNLFFQLTLQKWLALLVHFYAGQVFFLYPSPCLVSQFASSLPNLVSTI